MATIALKNISQTLYTRLKYFAGLRHRSVDSAIIRSPGESRRVWKGDPEQLPDETEAFPRPILLL